MSRIVGSSAAMADLRQKIAAVAPTPLPILLVGETGTGKEVAALEIHDKSGRRGPFVPIDCAALSASLIESELFGHERGAFTGAGHRREGLVAAARGGTFFLDEIGELPLATQTRLLRLLQEGTYRLVGGEQEIEADIRVVAATWRDLRHGVREGRFRRDLFHRLAVVELTLPSLRARPEDVDVLLDHFLDESSEETGRLPPEIPATLRAHLRSLPWNGNVRELRNVARYLCAMARGPKAALSDLPARHHVVAPVPGQPESVPLRTDLPYLDARRVWLDAFQLRYVSALLDEHDGNVSAAARAAGMDRRSIQRILARRRSED